MTRRDPKIEKIAEEQGLPYRRVFKRRYNGWTDEELKSGIRPRKKWATPDYLPKWGGAYSRGEDLFRCLIFEVVKSLTQLDEWENYLLTCLVCRGLLDKLNLDKSNLR